MKRKTVFILVLVATLIGVFFQLFKKNEAPLCLNADEAAFGYNAYSLLKTGADEYGHALPLRLLSFGDYKLPLYSYLSIPFVGIFGLNDFSVRALNVILGIVLIPLMFFLTKEVFEDIRVATIASFLTALNTSHYILTRHAHEGVLSTVLVLTTLLCFIKYLKNKRFVFLMWTNVLLLLAAFSYHTGRIFLLFFALAQLISFAQEKKKNVKYIVLLIAIVSVPFLIDASYGANRVQNLAFYKDIGFGLRINEALNEHPVRTIHNKLSQAVIEISNRYIIQLSPEFLTLTGDKNPRFGTGIGMVTPTEYLLFFAGVYFLFVKKQKFRNLLLVLIAITPLANAFTWTQASVIRTYILTFLVIMVVSYGITYLYLDLKKTRWRYIFLPLAVSFVFFTVINWDYYLYHSFKKPDVVRAWQCGYKDLTTYIQSNYSKYDRFVITRKHGQPYIYLLYYLGSDPKKYQSQARLTPPDEFGFGQVESFDKFDFIFSFDKSAKKTVYIGYPDDFNNLKIDSSKFKKVTFGTQDMFWIYETI